MSVNAHLFTDLVIVACSDGILYPLTECCSASGKGSGDAIVCRSCYREVDDVYGLAIPLEAPNAAAIVASWTDVPAAEVDAAMAQWLRTSV